MRHSITEEIRKKQRNTILKKRPVLRDRNSDVGLNNLIYMTHKNFNKIKLEQILVFCYDLTFYIQFNDIAKHLL